MKNPEPHGTRFTSISRGIPPVVDARVLSHSQVAPRLPMIFVHRPFFGKVLVREFVLLCVMRFKTRKGQIIVKLKSTIVVRVMSELATVVVTVRGQTYGSLELDKLAQLADDLAAARDLCSADHNRVVIDLTGVSMMGSSFVCELYRWIGTLDCDSS